jgi:hypothetical protein
VNQKNHPNSPRWQFETGRAYEELSLHHEEREKEFTDLAVNHFQQAARLGGGHQAAGLIAIVHMSSVHHIDISASLLDELNAALATAKVGPTTILNFEQLTLCVAHKECYLPYDMLETFHKSLMSNPIVNLSARGRLKADHAQLALNTNHLSVAHNLLLQAIEDDPGHLQHYLNLAYLQILLGQVKEAETVLAEASEKDWLGIHQTRISALIKQLREAKERQGIDTDTPPPDSHLGVN